MKLVLLALLMGGTLLAQTPAATAAQPEEPVAGGAAKNQGAEPQSPPVRNADPQVRPDRLAPGKLRTEEMLAKLREALKNSAANRPCAVPLSAIPPQGAPAPMKTNPPPDPDRFATKDAPLRAPSCDDVKR